jgi:4a-hydroxytetrahydrobiopterin dehydratase
VSSSTTTTWPSNLLRVGDLTCVSLIELLDVAGRMKADPDGWAPWGSVRAVADAHEAVLGADAVYTAAWQGTVARDAATMRDYRVDAKLMRVASRSAPSDRWQRNEATLERELTFRDFEEAMRFMERVAQAAVDYERRPDMCVSHFNRVRLAIENPHHAPLTKPELRLASKVDAILDEHHPGVR